MHDIDFVTDRYLRRYDAFGGIGVPRDSFLWANTRLGIASKRVVHGFRNAGLSMRRLGRMTQQASDAVAKFGDSLRR